MKSPKSSVINPKLLQKKEMLKALELTRRAKQPSRGDTQHPEAQIVFKAIKDLIPTAKVRVAVENNVLFVAGQTYELRAWLRQAGFQFDREKTKSWTIKLES